MHLGPFGCLTEFGTKRAELVQKFVPRSRVGIFCKERTRSTPLDPKLMFWCVSYYSGAFGTVGCLIELGAKRAEQGQKFVPRSRFIIFRNESSRSTPLDTKLTLWCVLYYLGAFGTVWLPYGTRCKTDRTSAFHTIWDRLVALRNSVQNGSNWCKSSCHEVASEFFTMNAPDPPLWTLNRHFAMFRTIWMHLGPFGCLTKLGAKWVELVQKFVPRSRIGIFLIERTRSTPLDPKLTFWCVSNYLGAFGTVWLPFETRCKTGRTSAKVRATKSRQNYSQRTDPITHWTLN